MRVRTSVVIPARNEPTLPDTIGCICAELPSDGEVLVVDDHSDVPLDGEIARLDRRVRVYRPRTRVGVAVARNIGARRTTGDVLVFADAHVRPRAGWLGLVDLIDDPKVGATGPALVDGQSGARGEGLRFVDAATNTEWLEPRGRLPHPVPLLPGFFIAMRRQTFADVGGFDSGMVGYGVEDIELCLHLVMLGYDCLLVPELEVEHAPVPGVPEYQLDWESGLHNILRLGVVHFGTRRVDELFSAYRDYETFHSARAAVAAGGAEQRRRAVQAVRRFDDDWFFELCDNA